jgi:hypothetical protein
LKIAEIVKFILANLYPSPLIPLPQGARKMEERERRKLFRQSVLRNKITLNGSKNMTEKEILEMKPGQELDILVAKEIMGHRVIKDENLGNMERFKSRKDQSTVFGLVQSYSEDVLIAAQVVDKMIEKGYEEAPSWVDFGGGKYTQAEAICKAALSNLIISRKKTEVADNILRMALGDNDDEDD